MCSVYNTSYVNLMLNSLKAKTIKAENPYFWILYYIVKFGNLRIREKQKHLTTFTSKFSLASYWNYLGQQTN